MWTLIKDDKGWTDYKADISVKMNTAVKQVAWGPDPTTYPCLVSTLMPLRGESTQRAYSAFVYLQDCETLFKAAGRSLGATDTVSPPNQAQFNRWVAAKLMTLTHYMVETGLCAPKGGVAANQQAFEDKLLEMIDLVDRYRTEDREKLLEHMPGHTRTILDTLT